MAEPIGGHVAPGFERVRDAFERNFSEHGEVGGSCSVYLESEPVVDLWGGFADQQRRLGFGYVMNQMQLGLTGDARATGLVEAVYASLNA